MKTKIYSLCCVALLWGLSHSTQAQTIVTYAGVNGAPAGYAGDGGPANFATLDHPRSMAIDDTGNVYIVDAYNNMIRKVNPAGDITHFSGALAGGYGGDGGDAEFAQYDHPNYVIFDATAQNMYICDPSNARIRKINMATNIITTVVGDGNSGYLGDGGPATAAEINFPTALAMDAAGNLYIADANNNCIRKVDASGIITTIAGSPGMTGYSGEGGPATAANVDFPYGLAVDNAGNLYVGLYYDSRICKINTAGTITTYAGIGGGSGMGTGGDGGPATAAQLDQPWGIFMDYPGNLYIADNANNRIKKVNTSGIISTVAGTGGFGSGGDSGPATAAQFKGPQGVIVGADGSIYITDNLMPIVRQVIGTLINSPSFTGGDHQSMPLCVSAPATSINSQLAVADADAGQLITWSVVQAPLHGTLAAAYSTTTTGGTLTPTGLTYTPTTAYAGTDSFKVRVYDGTASDTTTVVLTMSPCLVNNPPVFISGATQSLPVCKNASATDINALLAVSDIDVGQTETWSVITVPSHGTLVAVYSTTSTGGTLTTTGLSYTPVSGYTGSDVFRVRVFDGTDSDTTTVNVTVNTCPTAVANVGAGDNGIKIYPNPGTGIFTFVLPSYAEEAVHIVITNMVGEKVKEINTTTNKNTEVRLNEAPGIYFLNAITAHGSLSTKIVISP